MGLSRGRNRVCQNRGSGAKLHSQAAEMKGSLGLLDLSFFFFYLSLRPPAPLRLSLALSAIKGRSCLTEEAMLEGKVDGLCGWNDWGEISDKDEKRGGYKRSQCLLPSLMVTAAAVGSCLIKSLPLVEAEFQKCQARTQKRDTRSSAQRTASESNAGNKGNKVHPLIYIDADCKIDQTYSWKRSISQMIKCTKRCNTLF